MSTEPSQLAAALVELQSQLPHIRKSETATVPTKTGGQYQYTYAGLAQVTEEIIPLLVKLGMSWVCRPSLTERGEFVLAYELRHIGGESITGAWPLTKGTPQDIGGQITYARRYCLLAVTGVATADDDDDAAKATAAASRRTARPKAEQGDGGPAKITGDQMAKMQALFTQQGVTDREAKLDFAREVIGPEHVINSATDLTKVQASEVIDKLSRWVKQDEPPAESPVSP